MEELNEEVVESKKGLTGRSEGKPTILIPGEIESVSKRGVTVAAGTVYDYKQNKFQQNINEELIGGVQQVNDYLNDNVKGTLSEHSSEIENISEALEENIPYVIVYENQTVNIPCDPYGDYEGSEQEVGTVVKLYRGNIQKEIEYDNSIVIESPTDKGFDTEVIEDDGSAIISISYTDISNLDDATEVNFYIISEGKAYYGKVIFNKVKRGKSAYEEWKDLHPEITNPTPDLFIAELKNTDIVHGPKFATDITSANEPKTIYYIPNSSDSTTYDIVFVDEQDGTITKSSLAEGIPGDITNYAGIYDVSADHNNTSYATLALAIAAIANTAKKGGMTIKYKDSNGNYHQYRYLLADTTDNDKFTDEDNWEADNIIGLEDSSNGSDFEVGDKRGNVIVRCANGDFETKNFNSAKSQQNTGERDYNEFSASTDYAIGDIVRKDGLLYKFISEHDAGAWNDSDVVQTSIAQILSSNIPDNVPTVEDTNDADLEFSDKRNKVLARFSEGEFETKNFNSRHALKNKWNGKKIVWNGHSITYGSNVDEVYTFPYLVCQRLGATYRNYSIGGSTLAKIPESYDKMYLSVADWNAAVANNQVDTTKSYLVKDVANGVNRVVRPFGLYSYSNGSWNVNAVAARTSANTYRTPLVDRITEMDTDADLVIICIGGNDWFHSLDNGTWIRIGEPYEGGVLNVDKESVCGAMNLICQNLSDTYISNGKRVLFVTECYSFPYYVNNQAGYNINSPYTKKMSMTYREFFTILMEIAANYGIPYWDLEKECCLSCYSDWWVSQEDLAVNRKSHPNAQGHARVADILSNKLLTF